MITQDVVLKHDLTCSGDGLIVGASGVTIDLRGHTLSGTGAGTGIRINWLSGVPNAAVNDTVIKRGTIAGFGTGVYLHLANGARLERVDVVDCGYAGVFIPQLRAWQVDGPRLPYEFLSSSFSDNGLGIEAFDADDVRVERSRFERNTRGISAYSNANNWQIRDSRFTDNDLGAIYSTENSSWTIERNMLRDNGAVGLYLFAGPVVHLVRDNIISGHHVGIDVVTPWRGNEVAGNRIKDNGVGLRVRHVVDGGLLLHDNVFASNGAAGALIDLSFARQPVEISNNRFDKNGYSPGSFVAPDGSPLDDGLHVRAPASVTVLVSDNSATRNADLGLEAPTATDGGGNSGRWNGNPAQCVGVIC